MIILGLSLSSDSHASILIDGEMRTTIGEERLSRFKNHTGFPERAIKKCLEIEGISPSEVDVVAIGYKAIMRMTHSSDIKGFVEGDGTLDYSNEKPLSYRIQKIGNLISDDLRKLTGRKNKQKTVMDCIVERLTRIGITAPIEETDHHMAHALSGYYFCGHEKSLIITADGSGDGLSGGVYLGDAGKVETLHTTSSKESMGVLYAATTKYCGFKRHRHEGKITGLAAYGDPLKLIDHFRKIVRLTDDKASFVYDRNVIGEDKKRFSSIVGKYMNYINGSYIPGFMTSRILDYFRREFRGADIADIAAATQKHFEDLYVEHVKAMVEKTGVTDLSLAGGNFANVKLNQRLLDETGATSVFIHPNMGDGGTAVGSAIDVWLDRQAKAGVKYDVRKMPNAYLGTDVDYEAVPELARKYGFFIEDLPDAEAQVARLLNEGFVIGRINGKMEYGPRALGNRSILAHPFNKEVNDTLNKRLSRTEFMPFAPSVLAEKADEYYEGGSNALYPGEFMTITMNVKDVAKKANAVNHVDNTARPHFVNPTNNPSYYKIIKEFEKLTGLGIIINTSFNKHEEPIICSAEDGFQRLKDESVEYLSIGSYLVRKHENPIPFQQSE